MCRQRDILSRHSVRCPTTWQLRRGMMGRSKIEVILLMIESRLKSTMSCDIALKLANSCRTSTPFTDRAAPAFYPGTTRRTIARHRIAIRTAVHQSSCQWPARPICDSPHFSLAITAPSWFAPPSAAPLHRFDGILWLAWIKWAAQALFLSQAHKRGAPNRNALSHYRKKSGIPISP